MSCKVLPNLFHDSVKFHWEFLPRICWGVQGAGTQGPGTKTAFLVGRCPNLQEQPQPELLPLGKGSRNLRNVRSGICWTKQCLCSALTFPAPIPHDLAPQNWLLSSAWEQKSCKDPGSKEGEVHSVADTSLTPAGATFPGSGGILRTDRTHPVLGVPAPFGPVLPAFGTPPPLASPTPAFSSSSSLIIPEVESLSRLSVQLGMMVKQILSHLTFIKAIPHSAANAGEELKGERPWVNTKWQRLGNQAQIIQSPVSKNCSTSPGSCRSFQQWEKKWKCYSKGPKWIQLLRTLSIKFHMTRERTNPTKPQELGVKSEYICIIYWLY